MNILKPLYYIALIFSGVISGVTGNPINGNPLRSNCDKINCNAGRNSKTTTTNGEPVANYRTSEDYRRCGINGLPFTINCDSKFSAFLSLENCIARNILPSNHCPPIATGKAYYPSDRKYMDVRDLPNGCKEEYKRKYYKVKGAINDGNKGKSCG